MPKELPGAQGNKPNPPPLVNPTAPKPPIPLSWDDFGRQASALFEILARDGSQAADAFKRWLDDARRGIYR